MPEPTDLSGWLEGHRVRLEPVDEAQIVGIAHALERARSIVGRLRHGSAAGAATVRSILLVGPPGTGKTLTARWIAGQLGDVPAYDLPTEQLSPERIRSVFLLLAHRPRSVVFLPEADAIILERRDADADARRALFAFLEALDGLAPVPPDRGPVVIATTNRSAFELDDAATRAGRLGLRIRFALPSSAERIELWRRFAEPAVDAVSIDWSRLAAMTARWTPAEIRAAVDDALGLALARSGSGAAMTEADLLAAARRGGSIEPEDDEPLPELPQVAIHEAGHVACAVALGLEVRSVHLLIGHRGGRTETGAEGRVMRAHDLAVGAVVALGGLAAEELLCENPTLGSVPDVREATDLLIRRIEAGVDPEFAPVSRKAWDSAFGVGPIDPLMAPRVLAALSTARDQARAIVASQGSAIGLFAQELLSASILTGERLTAALARAGWSQA